MRIKDRRAAMKHAKRMLQSVGHGQFFMFVSEGHCGHVQRALNDAEIATLPPGWMAIPAIDERGPMLPWDAT